MALSRAQRKAEEERLQKTLSVIRQQLDDWQSVASSRRSTARETRAKMWEELPSHVRDFDDVVEMTQGLQELSREERSLAMARRRVRQLRRMLETPYFGRCDFRPEASDTTQVMYVGIGSLIDEETGRHLVYDWRAPIASLYYDFEPGPAHYTAPRGRVEGRVERKRQFRIRDGQLEQVFDSSIHIGDEVLQSILAQSRGGRMRSIVQTIQRAQNRIIRDEKSPLLIVQGAAGSGKSSIALHRVAYLLYRNRGRLTSENILVLSPNPLFSAYAAQVLPELGEEPMNQTTFHAFAQRALRGTGVTLQRRHEHMEDLLAADPQEDAGWLEGVAFKGSRAFHELMRRYVTYLASGEWAPWKDLTYHGEVVLTAQAMQERFAREYGYLPLQRRAAKLKRRAVQEIDRLKAAGVGPKEDVLETGGEDGAPETALGTPGPDGDAQVPAVDLEQVAVMERLDSMLSLDTIGAYVRLFTDDALFQRLSHDLPLPRAVASIRAQTAAAVEDGVVGYEDVSPLLLLHTALEGTLDMPEIRHVIIDEAQDYSRFEYAIIGALFPSSRYTVLGDRNQSIYPYTSIEGYEVVPELLGEKQAMQVTLTRSYRSTQEIVAFSRALLSGGEPVEGVARSGDRPLLLQVSQEEEEADVLAAELGRLVNQGRESAAVIVRTLAEAEELAERLSERGHRIRCVTPDDDWVRGMVVLPCYVAKGLEFEAVLIPYADSYDTDVPLERHLLYTACTRAMHDLRLIYETAPAWLERLDGDLYRRRAFSL